MASYIQLTRPNPTVTAATIKDYAAAITAFDGAGVAGYVIFEEACRAAQPDAALAKRANDKGFREMQHALYGDFETPIGNSNTTYQDIFCTETGDRVVLVKQAHFDTIDVW